jgi:hypothetical protein
MAEGLENAQELPLRGTTLHIVSGAQSLVQSYVYSIKVHIVWNQSALGSWSQVTGSRLKEQLRRTLCDTRKHECFARVASHQTQCIIAYLKVR